MSFYGTNGRHKLPLMTVADKHDVTLEDVEADLMGDDWYYLNDVREQEDNFRTRWLRGNKQ